MKFSKFTSCLLQWPMSRLLVVFFLFLLSGKVTAQSPCTSIYSTYILECTSTTWCGAETGPSTVPVYTYCPHTFPLKNTGTSLSCAGATYTCVANGYYLQISSVTYTDPCSIVHTYTYPGSPCPYITSFSYTPFTVYPLGCTTASVAFSSFTEPGTYTIHYNMYMPGFPTTPLPLILGGLYNTVTVTGAISGWSVSPTFQSVPSGGGSYSASVYSGVCGSYTLTFADSWIHFSSYGTGLFNYTVDPNTTCSPRTGHIYVNDFIDGIPSICTLTVSQSSAYTISSAPTSISASSYSICPGGSTTLSIIGGTLGTGASWFWYSGGCGGTFIGSGTTVTVAPGSTTTYYVQAVGTCNTTSCANVTINVNSLSTPPSSITASLASICVGSSTYLTVLGGSLGTGANWVWYAGSCGGSPIGYGSSITVSPGTTTTYFARAEGTCNTTGCISMTVIVNPMPSAVAMTGGGTFCGSATITASGSGGTIYYQGTSSGGTSTSTPSSSQVITSSGTYYFRSMSSAGCWGPEGNVTVIINPLPVAGTISGTPTVCEGSMVALTDATTGGIWNSGGTGIATVGSTGIVTGVAAGSTIISYSVTNTCGTAIATATITVNPLPVAGTIIGAPSVCEGSVITLSDATTGGIWGSSGTGIATIGSTGIVTGVAPGSMMISYSVTNTCGTAIATATITVNPLPVAGTITGASNVCAGATITLTDGTTGGIWGSSNMGIATVGSTGIVIGVAAGSAIISYSMTNGCGTAITTQSITVNPLPVAGIITGSSSVCEGATITLTDATPGGVWSSGSIGIATIGSTGMVTGVAVGSSIISYSVTNVCGTAYVTTSISVNPLPFSGTITGASNVCEGATITLTDATTGGVWNSSGTGIATVGSTGIITGVTGGSVLISYSVTNTCGTAIATQPITVNPLPVAGTITGPSIVCAGATISLTDATTGGIWNSSNVTATVSGGVVTGLSAGIDTISYSVTNICGTATATKTITINIIPVAGIIVGVSSVCTGASITLTDVTTGGIWSSSNTTASVFGGVVMGLSAGIDTINYTVTNTCGTATATKTITINPLPYAGAIAGMSNVCVGSTITLTDTIAGGVWSSSNLTATVLSGVVTGVLAGTDTIHYAVSNICGIAHAILTITVNPLPAVSIISGDSTVCIGAMIVLTDSISGGLWTSSNTIATVSSGVVTGILVGSDTISYIITNLCGTAIATKNVIVVGCTLGQNTITNYQSELDIVPNPNEGTFMLILSANVNEYLVVTITNIVGEIVKELSTSTNKATDIRLDVPPGIYIVSASTENKRYMAKVIVK